MNYYDARERLKETGVFDYTCMNDGKIWPVGYCAGWKEVNDRPKFFSDHMWAEHLTWARKEEQAPYFSFYHTDGHRSKEEAYECYKRYLLDHRLRLDLTYEDTQKRCEVCGTWTQKAAEVDNGRVFNLCDQHLNRETVEKLFSVGQCMSSY